MRYLFAILAFAAFAVQAATVDFAVTTPQPVLATTTTVPMMGGGTFTQKSWIVTVTAKVAGNAAPGVVQYFQTAPVKKWLGYGGTIDANGVPPVQTFNLSGPGNFSVMAQFAESGPNRTAGPVAVSTPVTVVAK